MIFETAASHGKQLLEVRDTSTSGYPRRIFEGILLVLGVVVGVAVGRWWALAIAVPIGFWFALEFEGFENSSPPYWDFGAVVTLVIAAAIAAGILLRRSLTRR